ncbi:MAG: hypothetical protein A3A57_00315 [Candidatus Woykebacteria bacterium RIFCSPLOWO2_01_FULL_41_12]|uniref:VTT domain-containing protein n=1 Tax=Candidatus Woykebacteria bacterium RIFCSPLOWO2_01_FULL_41_12 TaxID=1802604 RepID=A0A1G1WSF7_9BACT|nr:MAG: hypothetical protein A3A57_00315 [Candidatus Woykebacteria bacterium RIFCSPLOWO2_01_FULL_41_12]
METVFFLFDLLIHIDKYLIDLINNFGYFTYAVLFGVIFAETGFVVTPFLPGDSLLFAAGSFATKSVLNPIVLFTSLSAAAILGDTINYWIGHFVGEKVFSTDSRFFKKEYLDRTHAFYEKHGGKTIILARFIPIIRTFAPFVAGVGKMNYFWFLTYNVIGGLFWVGIFVFGGYYFGNIAFVQKNFSLVIVAIIIISLLPGIIEYLRHKKPSPTKPS